MQLGILVKILFKNSIWKAHMKMREDNNPEGIDTGSVNWIDVSYVELLGPNTGQLKTIGYEYILKNFV
jgi:hypothetical protein